MRNKLWWSLARDSGKVAAIMQLIDVSHLLASAHAAGITSARQVASSMTPLVSVMVERRAIALIAVPDSHELDPTDVFTELKTKLWCHWHPIFFWGFILVPKLLLCLRVEKAPNMPHSCWATHWVNGIRAGEFQLTKLLHCTNKSGLETHTFHSQTFASEPTASGFGLLGHLHKTR